MNEISVDYSENTIRSWPLGSKTILWLAVSNKYLLAEKPASEVIQKIGNGEDIRSIIRFCCDEFTVSTEAAKTLVNEIQQYLNEYLKPEDHPNELVENNETIQIKPSVIASKKYYSIFGITFLVEYETKEMELLIKPKFEYLEVPIIKKPDHHFQVLSSNKKNALWVDGERIGIWNLTDNHFLSGKFSMQILQKIYKQEETDWMAVFHAAGITNGEKCLIFLGDSGNGKSTLSAILMANGLEVLADDFLPIESKTGLVCHFPSAISIKNKAWEMLLPSFPQLSYAKEYNNTSAGKSFRYIPANCQNLLCVPCVGLVFVKFEKDAGFCFEELPGEDAFAHLVPDSWISPTSENATSFVSWFTSLPYYRLTYSDNEQMIQTIKKMLNNDL